VKTPFGCDLYERYSNFLCSGEHFPESADASARSENIHPPNLGNPSFHTASAVRNRNWAAEMAQMLHQAHFDTKGGLPTFSAGTSWVAALCLRADSGKRLLSRSNWTSHMRMPTLVGEYGARLSIPEGLVSHAEQCKFRVRCYGGRNSVLTEAAE